MRTIRLFLLSALVGCGDAAKPPPPPATPPTPASDAAKPGPLMVGSKKKEAVAPERNVAWTTIDTHQDAPDALQEAARAAKGAPVVYVGATWCGPCKAYKASLSDPKMKQAHVPVQILELDADKHPNTLQWAGITPNGVPHWEMVDSGGKSIGKTIDGSAWEANTVDNMAPALSKFFTGG